VGGIRGVRVLMHALMPRAQSRDLARLVQPAYPLLPRQLPTYHEQQKTNQSILPARSSISFSGTTTSAFGNLFRLLTSKSGPAFQPHRDRFLMSDMLLVHHTVRGARHPLIFSVTIPRNERATRYSACQWVPFLRVRSRVHLRT